MTINTLHRQKATFWSMLLMLCL